MNNDMFIYNPDAPYWTTGPEGRKVAGAEGEYATLRCNVDSNPNGTYKWKLDGSTLPGEDGAAFQIANVTADDYNGFYACVVSNIIDSKTHQSEFPITLVLRGGPDAPSALEVTHITSVSADIHWTAGFDGGYQDAWFEVAYKLGSEPDFGGWEKVDGVPAGQTVTHRISSLSEQSDYLVRVKAVNSHDDRNESSPIEANFKTKSKLHYWAIVARNSFNHVKVILKFAFKTV